MRCKLGNRNEYKTFHYLEDSNLSVECLAFLASMSKFAQSRVEGYGSPGESN